MMIHKLIPTLLTVGVTAGLSVAQQGEGSTQEPGQFAGATARIEARLEESLQTLAAERQRIATEKVPLAAQLRKVQGELSELRLEYTERSTSLEAMALKLDKLRGDTRFQDLVERVGLRLWR